MKTIEDVIKKDTKWLIHFLKEKHSLNAYFTKWMYQNIEEKSSDYNIWLNFILSKKNYYTNNFEIYVLKKQWCNLLYKNGILVDSLVLFATWGKEPYVYSHNISIESREWIILRNNFLDLKQQLFLIKADMKL